MKPLRQKLVRPVLITFVSVVFLAVLLLTTNPYHLPLIVLILPFLLIFVVIYEVIRLVFLKSDLEEHKKKQRFNASIFAGGIVTLALLQSIRQLSLKDVIIIVILIIGASLYLRRIDL